MFEKVFGKGDLVEAEAKWRIYADVWPALIGIDSLTRSCWEERHRGLVTESQTQFEQWVRNFQGHGRHLATFARWLETAAAGALRLTALVWLEQALLCEASDLVHDRAATIDAMASLLSVIWQSGESDLRQNLVAFSAFRSLLQWLADEQNAVALTLIGRIGGL